VGAAHEVASEQTEYTEGGVTGWQLFSATNSPLDSAGGWSVM